MKELVQHLYDNRAFKPAPSLLELASAHVPFADLGGVVAAPEPRVRSGIEEGDGITVLVGGSGSGKSSVLACIASELAGSPTPAGRRYLPVFVPVAARPAVADDLGAFGRAAAREVLLALRAGLPHEYRDRLEQISAPAVTRQQTGPKFNASLVGRVFGRSGADLGVDLGGDVVSIVGVPDLDNRGGVQTLGDIVRARGHELVVIIEDTDAWARSDGGVAVARRFFTSVVRPMSSDTDVAIAVAVQTDWENHAEFGHLRERAVSVATMPLPASEEQARAMIRRILERRIARACDDRSLGDPDPVDATFTPAAVDMLGHVTYDSGGFRTALVRVRDAFDRHADALPDRIDKSHLLDAL